MSVKRYYNSSIMSGEMIESEGGGYVRYTDYIDLLNRCDLLEAELCRYQKELEVIIMTLEA